MEGGRECISEQLEVFQVITFPADAFTLVSSSLALSSLQSWVVADDEHALIPVYSATQRFRGSEPDSFGAPFFITVTADQARDATAITDAVIQQYRRLLPKSLTENYYHEQPSPDQIPLTTPSDVFETPDGVAEIRLDGSTSSLGPSPVIDPSLVGEGSLTPSLPALGAPMSDVVGNGVNGDYPSPPVDVVETLDGSPMDTDPSTPTTPLAQPVFDLLTFFDSLSPDSIPTGRRFGRTSPLVPSHHPSFPSSSSSSPNLYGSDDESELPSAKAPVGDKRPLLVKPGTGLVCVWTKDLVESAFGYDGERAFKEGYEQFVDPSLEAENNDKAKKGKKAVIGIEDCLDEFSKVETLGQDDLWYCSNVSPTRLNSGISRSPDSHLSLSSCSAVQGAPSCDEEARDLEDPRHPGRPSEAIRRGEEHEGQDRQPHRASFVLRLLFHADSWY